MVYTFIKADNTVAALYIFNIITVKSCSKMAEGFASVCESAALNCKVKSVDRQTKCSSCLKYKSEWEEMAEELITAKKKIVQLPQEDLNTYKDLARPRALDG